MTALFTGDSVEQDSGTHTIATDQTTVVAWGDPWERCRLLLLLETANGSGVFKEVPEWEMVGPGSKNVVTRGAAGLKMKLRLLGTNLTSVAPRISANAN